MTIAATTGPTRHTRTVQNLLWAGFAGILFFYAVMAFQYFFAHMTGQREWWNIFQAYLVSDEFSFGEGSVSVEQRVPYSANSYFMFVHATMGAVALAAGATQFVSEIRNRYPEVHRTLGKIYFFGIWLGMASGLLYLSSISVRDVFSGAAFGIGLWALDFLVLATSIRAYVAIRNGEVVTHQAWMAFNYSLVLATPVLRLFWVVFGMTLPLNQMVINSGVSTYLLPFCLLFGLIWFSAQRLRDRRVAIA